MTDIVVGSGPAGVAAAQGLLARGRRVLMIDAGETLEPEHEALRAKLAASEPDGWLAEDLARYRQTGDPGIRRYGSDFMFRDTEGFGADLPDWLGLKASFAEGGLSHAWGSAVLPYRQEDMAGWPITADDLTPHYKAVAGFMPIAGETDALAGLFPADDVAGRTPLPASAQGGRLLERLAPRRAQLEAEGVWFGRARQAVAASACRLCGLCLEGCPYELIYKASQTLAAMRANPAFEYRPGRRLTAFAETATGVTLWCGGEEITGNRLFLAAGVLPTAQVVLTSLARDRELTLLDSQHMFLPMLHRWTAPRDPATEPRHALTQAFVEITDPAVSPFTVHAQLYTYNEVYAADMKARFGARAPFLGPLFEMLGRRLIVAQMFLHSDHSHRAGLSLSPNGRLQARRIDNPQMEPTATRARLKMAKAMGKAGLTALIPASRLEPIGSSFHAGGTLPMRASPMGLETDALGRPAGLSRVHVVDASVLPAIPATTITYSVMANAHRIAATAPENGG